MEHTKYNEIIKLHEMLTEANIPHEFHRLYDGYQICYPAKQNCIADAIEHYGSYGNDEDTLEIMGLLTEEEWEQDGVLGHLTAEEVFKRFKSHYDTVGNK